MDVGLVARRRTGSARSASRRPGAARSSARPRPRFGPRCPPVPGDGLDEQVADLGGEHGQLVGVEIAQVGRRTDLIAAVASRFLMLRAARSGGRGRRVATHSTWCVIGKASKARSPVSSQPGRPRGRRRRGRACRGRRTRSRPPAAPSASSADITAWPAPARGGSSTTRSGRTSSPRRACGVDPAAAHLGLRQVGEVRLGVGDGLGVGLDAEHPARRADGVGERRGERARAGVEVERRSRPAAGASESSSAAANASSGGRVDLPEPAGGHLEGRARPRDASAPAARRAPRPGPAVAARGPGGPGRGGGRARSRHRSAPRGDLDPGEPGPVLARARPRRRPSGPRAGSGPPARSRPSGAGAARAGRPRRPRSRSGCASPAARRATPRRRRAAAPRPARRAGRTARAAPPP